MLLQTQQVRCLLQVLVLLDALRNPVKTEPLKAKQAEQAEALEAQVEFGHMHCTWQLLTFQ